MHFIVNIRSHLHIWSFVLCRSVVSGGMGDIMKKNLRNSIISLIIILVILSSAGYFIFRVTEDQVVVNKMVRFHEIQLDSERVLKDKEAVKQFTYAVRFAAK